MLESALTRMSSARPLALPDGQKAERGQQAFVGDREIAERRELRGKLGGIFGNTSATKLMAMTGWPAVLK